MGRNVKTIRITEIPKNGSILYFLIGYVIPALQNGMVLIITRNRGGETTGSLNSLKQKGSEQLY
jgi:hypothetical protein